MLPLLGLLVFGCVDFGRFAYAYIAVTNAARAGAGYGSVNPYTPATLDTWKTKVKQVVADDMDSLEGFDPNQVTVVPVTESGGYLRVQVAVPCLFRTWVSWPGVPSELTVQGTVEMRALYPAP
jgi:Flp pilus assembly protein TadG